MKITPNLRLIGISVLTLALGVGCAAQQQQPEPEPAPAPAPAPKAEAPSAAEKAIAAAKEAIAKAKAKDWVWRDTEKLLKNAEKALSEGKEDKAVEMANEARRQAELAVKQYYAEQSVDRNRTLQYMPEGKSYTVMRGDSLWSISGKGEIYGDPYRWPLIYKANSNKIGDADLIYPGQEFDIDTSPSAGEVDAAVQHAKTRGAWSIGVVEDSDRAYLAR